MLDMREWVLRAAGFAPQLTRRGGHLVANLEVRPPLTVEELATLEGSLDCTFPAALRCFLSDGAARCRFSYEWFPPPPRRSALEEILPSYDSVSGGATLCDTEGMPAHRSRCQELARYGWMSEFPGEQARWLHGLPFVYLEYGDFLALDLSSGRPDPPVVYLCHDDESRVIARSFEAFLQAWERLCYIGPEIWVLEPYRDPESGFLDPETQLASELRSLFGIA